jgi:Rieske Fe-S protein
MSEAGPARRSVLSGVAIAAVAGTAGFGIARGNGAATAAASGTGNAYGAAPVPNADGLPAMPTGVALAPVVKIPMAGGLILNKRRIVLTKDGQGAVHGFTAVCPHQGCTVSEVEKGLIGCPCHGSSFDAETGAVVRGPATRGLAVIPITVVDGTVYTT